MYNPDAPFGLESFDLEALDRLMAERKHRGYLLKYVFIPNIPPGILESQDSEGIFEIKEIIFSSLIPFSPM
jgi:hypothetical protein